MYQIPSNLSIEEKQGRKYATFDWLRFKDSEEITACFLDGKWLDIDTGYDWTQEVESKISKISQDLEKQSNKEAVKGLRELFDGP